MSKKEELKMLFDFLIEMLKEETPKESTESTETKKELLTEEIKEDKNETTIFDFNHVLNLMKKVDSIQDEKAKINSVVNQNKKVLETELKKVKEEYDKIIKNEKTKEESISEGESLVNLNDETVNAVYNNKKGTISFIDDVLKK